jgi:hypothetical protein
MVGTVTHCFVFAERNYAEFPMLDAARGSVILLSLIKLSVRMQNVLILGSYAKWVLLC